MNDLNPDIKEHKKSSVEFTDEFDINCDGFKVGMLLKEARREAGLTQGDLAERMATQKSAISRIENHSSDIKLSTLDNFAKALGKRLKVRIV